MIPASINITFTKLTICIPFSIMEEQMHIYMYIPIQVKVKPNPIFLSETTKIYPILLSWIILHFRKELPIIRNIHHYVFDLFVLQINIIHSDFSTNILVSSKCQIITPKLILWQSIYQINSPVQYMPVEEHLEPMVLFLLLL